jgi:uncharacterized protein YfbU (UPF0304 family)
MAFTDEQKLIVTLLTEIHAKLAITDGIDPQFIQGMISSGHTWAVHWKYPELLKGEETPANVREVADVLDMWEVMERTAASFSVADRSQAASLSAPVSLSAAQFSGYSGNNEDEYSIVHILVEDLGRWSSFAGRDFNAHVPMVDVYDRMLGTYRLLNPIDSFSATLSVEDFAAVLKEQIHPENR